MSIFHFRGVVPPLWGSGVYRSIQFSAFEATYKSNLTLNRTIYFLNMNTVLLKGTRI